MSHFNIIIAKSYLNDSENLYMDHVLIAVDFQLSLFIAKLHRPLLFCLVCDQHSSSEMISIIPLLVKLVGDNRTVLGQLNGFNGQIGR